ncbi:MAG TPA: cytochrome c oxidase assembly protein, partial [Thalassospira sp.]|nr:cytochrome c oxidase assembly protein [Thalassospira sp.]
MADQKHADKTKARNKRVLLGCVAVVGGMIGLSY